MLETNEKKDNSSFELNKFDINNNNNNIKSEIKLKANNLSKELNFSFSKEKKIFGNDIFDLNPVKCGKLFCFFYLNEKPLITIGPTFYYNFVIIFIVNLINIINIIFINFNIHSFFSFIEYFLFYFQFIFHLITVFINEGIPEKKWFLSDELIKNLCRNEYLNQNFNFEKFQICKICNLLIFKNQNAFHCEFCNICCEEFDHHCKWIGKCIGKNNKFFFKIFLYLTFIYIIYSILLFIYFLLIFI